MRNADPGCVLWGACSDGHTKKRVKVHGEDGTVKKANKKTSQLQLLLTMPLDIVAEVRSATPALPSR